MLFNSYIFLFLLLPLSLLGFYLLGKLNNPRYAVIWLTGVSLVFYAWASPVYLALITGSILFNFAMGAALANLRSKKRWQKWVMASGIAVNILLLGYFKYANFFIDNVNTLLGSNLYISVIVLPLAISFFTLQQIGYLVDIYRGEECLHSIWEYSLFVTFFPKLLSGPIVRLKEMMPQIINEHRPYITSQNLIVGLTILLLGLFKKVILADNLGGCADPVFAAASSGAGISFFNSWIGALAYTFQLYFDFSGYCDMAIGIGLMFGIRLPLNFYSPYKATSVIDFWRRWHITLSTFIRDYIYIPLGGNRHGFARQTVYLLVAMAIAGLWHGAGWTFVIWGALHGLYLVINHAWRRLCMSLGQDTVKSSRLSTVVSVLITFVAVTIAWVFFRADSVNSAIIMLKGMVGVNGFQIPYILQAQLGDIAQILTQVGITFNILSVPGFSSPAILMILACFFICWFLPNVQEYMSEFKPALGSSRWAGKQPRLSFLKWRPSLVSSLAISCIGVLGILELSHKVTFIYFRF